MDGRAVAADERGDLHNTEGAPRKPLDGVELLRRETFGHFPLPSHYGFDLDWSP